MRKSRNYWIKRQKKLLAKTDVLTNKYLNKLYKEYQKSLYELSRTISNYYYKYGKDEILEYQEMLKKLNSSDLKMLYEDYDSLTNKYPQATKYKGIRNSYYKLTRAEAMKFDTDMKLGKLFGDYDKQFEEFLKKIANEGYKNILNSGIPDNVLKEVLNSRWINKENFSDRLWNNKAKLEEMLNKHIIDGIKQGKPYREIAKQISDALNSSFGDAERLVRTEMAFVQESAQLKGYIEDGIEQYEYLAIMDELTSEICNSLEGTIHFVKDAQVGINYPPMHPRCRSTTIPVINKKKNKSRR